MSSTPAKPTPKSIRGDAHNEKRGTEKGRSWANWSNYSSQRGFFCLWLPQKVPLRWKWSFCIWKRVRVFNPYRHLKSCLAGGDEQALLKAPVKEKLVTGTFNLSSYLKFNKREMTIFLFVKLVALKNYPISYLLTLLQLPLSNEGLFRAGTNTIVFAIFCNMQSQSCIGVGSKIAWCIGM